MPINYDIEYPKLQQKCQRLQARVEELERVFGHFHKHGRKGWLNDSCAKCGLDLRDRIHTRAATGQEVSDE